MGLFFIIFLKVIPLYANLILGFLSSKYLKVQRESIAILLFYIVGPIVVFAATISVKINLSIAILPIFLFLFGSIIALLTLSLFKNYWNDSSSNILAFSSGTGNTGYFGIPLAVTFFEPSLVDIYIFTMLASLLYEGTTGFYVVAKGSFTLKESIKKISKLPILYAFILGLSLNILGFEMSDEINYQINQFKVVYGVLGMMMLGMGLVGLKNNEGSFDIRFILISFCIKFIFWPLSMLLVIYLDKTFFGILNKDLYKVLFLFSIVPLAGNAVSIAVLLKTKPEKVSLSIFLSTVLSIILIPLYIFWYGSF